MALLLPPVSPVEPIDPSGPGLPGRAVMTQRWADLAWLHWPVAPEVVAPLLPTGVRPDVLDGVTWVGLVPFHMQRIALAGTPPLPWVGTFPETNVRLYSVGPDGRRGVVFRSLDAARGLPVAVARVGYRLPYHWARMRIERRGADLTYRARRRDGTSSLVRVRVGDRVTPTALDHFLSARWGLHTPWRGGTAFAPVAHGPWPVHQAELLELDDDLVVAAGLPRPVGPPLVRWSPGVDVAVGWPRRLPRTWV